MSILDLFLSNARQFKAPRVLELGTAQSIPGRSTMHREWLPNASEWLGTDMQAGPGPDVDIVADVHRLSEVVGRESFDVIVSCSTLEHVRYVQLAAHGIMKTLKVGGLLFVQTHQSFPLHSYPSDYWRFGTDALMSLFPPEMGMQTVADYEFPCRIVSERDPNTARCLAFLNVCCFARKTSPTPEQWVYELPTLQPGEQCSACEHVND